MKRFPGSLASALLLLRLLALPFAATAAGDECAPMPLTTELVALLAKRTELQSEVAAQKADFGLVFDATRELLVIEAAAASARSSTILPTVAMIFAQLMADCAKQEQEAHIQAAVDAAEAAGEVEESEDGAEGRYGTMESSYESLDEVRDLLTRLNDGILERWQIVSQPEGEWDQRGCACTRASLSALFASQFQPAAIGGCGDPKFSDMISWVLLSASQTCQMPS